MTRSTKQAYADGVISIYAGDHVMLTARREPGDVYETRSYVMTADEARDLAERLIDAASHVDKR